MKRFFKGLLIFFFYSFVLHFYGCVGLFYSFDQTLENGLQKSPYDAIIVPGYPYDGARGSWNKIMALRVHWAKYLYDRGYAQNIIFSGGAVYSPYIESKVMAEYAKALGIPPQNIFTEEKAEHSTENVYYSFQLARTKGFKKVAVATDFFQGCQLNFFIKEHKLPIAVLPAVIRLLRTIEQTEPNVDVTSALSAQPFKPLPEREGFWQRLHGTFGRNIDWEERDIFR